MLLFNKIFDLYTLPHLDDARHAEVGCGEAELEVVLGAALFVLYTLPHLDDARHAEVGGGKAELEVVLGAALFAEHDVILVQQDVPSLLPVSVDNKIFELLRKVSNRIR